MAPRPLATHTDDLARALADRARDLRDALADLPPRAPLRPALTALRPRVPDAAPDRLADTAAQLAVLALVTARSSVADRLTRAALRDLPGLDPQLQHLFARLAAPDLDPAIAAPLDAAAALLAAIDPATPDDPAVRFYEDFLAAHDAALREARGVYYTPRPAVDWLVRSVDHLLRTALAVPDGLASPTPLLDPAAGTGAFLQAVAAHVHAAVAARDPAAWPAHARDVLLPNLRACELLAVPHAIARLGLALRLARTGVRVAADELRIDRADALAAPPADPPPLLVVLGNPPYAGHSANHAPWIRDLLVDYRRDVPGLDRPGQAKWLQDDYVKFLRLAHWHVERSGRGVVAFVTNHAWLSNPTFRGMRRALLAAFDELYLLDLHGNSKKRERPPDARRDENVFEIQQGIALVLLVRRGPRDATPATVHHADLWGPRAHKLDFLATHTVATTPWRRLAPAAPDWLLVPQPPAALRDEYAAFWPLPRIFDKSGDPAPGILTTHDEFAVSRTPAESIIKIERLLATRSEAEARALFPLCRQSQWSYARAVQGLADGAWRTRIVPLLYRPFDVRHTVYDRNVAVHRRERVTAEFLPPRANLGLIASRTVEAGPWAHALCTTRPIAHHALSLKEINYLFPLWLHRGEGRVANLAAGFLAALPGAPTPEQAFAYIYAVLHAPAYRARYEPLLRADFPRIPIVRDPARFTALVAAGERLIALHTGAAAPASQPDFPIAGTNLVRAPRWLAGRVHINAAQFFAPVPEPAWSLVVGGYTPAAKWLKDRRHAALTPADIDHYKTLVAVLAATAELVTTIDAAVP